jgi:hypothetical protein
LNGERFMACVPPGSCAFLWGIGPLIFAPQRGLDFTVVYLHLLD